MKKLFSIIPIFFSLFVQAQTLKTSIDNTILEQGNRGITAIKLRNNLHLIVDSLRLKTQLPVNNNTVRSYLVEDYGITGGNRNGQPPIITRIKSWITASQLLTDLNAKPTIGYFQNVDTMNPNFYSGFDYVYSTSEKLLYKFVAGSGFLQDRIDQISENIITESGAIDKLLQKQLNSKQATLSGTGFVKSTAGTIFYDNSTYLSTSTAAITYAPLSSPSFSGTVSGISKSMVGLGSVDNTTDAGKPISTATQTALDAKQATLSGTGFVKSTAGTIFYDNSTYLTTSTAASTYLPINNPTATGTLTAPTIANSLGANFATTSGNIGIGTALPSYKLDISGTARVTDALTLGSGLNMPNAANINFLDGSAANRNVMTVSGSNVLFGDINNNFSTASNIYSYAKSSHNFYVNNNFAVKIDASGNVGIGTTPSYKLHVSGGNVYVGGAGAGVRIEDRSLSSRSYQFYVDGGALAVFNHNNSTQPLTITDGGNVGIGTTAPTYKTHIYGAGESISGGITNAGAKGASLYIQDQNSTSYSGGSIVFGANQGAGAAIKYEITDGANNTTGDLSFQVRNNITNTSLTTAVHIKNTGNIGIGTLTPAQRLDIVGIAQATQFKLAALNTAPASATAAGTVGEIRVDASYIYICTATNVWKRSSITSW